MSKPLLFDYPNPTKSFPSKPEMETIEDEEPPEEDSFDFLLNLCDPQHPKQQPKQDEFGFLLDFCKIPPDQEEHLRNCPFARESETFPTDPSPSNLQACPQPPTKATTSPPAADKFLTPPEQLPDSNPDDPKALPTSGDVKDVEIVELISDEEVVVKKVETLRPNCSDGGTEKKRKRKLPFSMTGKGSWDHIDKDDRRGDRGKNEFLELVDKAAKLIKKEENEEYDGDILETAIKRGLKLPRPKWWPPEGFN